MYIQRLIIYANCKNAVLAACVITVHCSVLSWVKSNCT